MLETLRRKFQEWWNGPKEALPEETIVNPLKLKAGDWVLIDRLDYRHLSFKVTGLREYASGLGIFIDYDLLALTNSGDEVVAKIRLIPKSTMGYNFFLLKQFDKLAYDDGLYQACLLVDTALGVGEDKMEDGKDAEFWRPKGSPQFYSATVTTLVDQNADGRIDGSSEVSKSRMKVWDFSREATCDKLPTVQYLYVEMDIESKGFALYSGYQIEQFNIR